MFGSIEINTGGMPVSSSNVWIGAFFERNLFIGDLFSILVLANINQNVGNEIGNPMILPMIVFHKLF